MVALGQVMNSPTNTVFLMLEALLFLKHDLFSFCLFLFLFGGRIVVLVLVMVIVVIAFQIARERQCQNIGRKFWIFFLILPLGWAPVSGADFWAQSISILVFPSPTSSMFTSSGFVFTKSVEYSIKSSNTINNFLRFRTSSGYVSNPTGLSVNALIIPISVCCY